MNSYGPTRLGVLFCLLAGTSFAQPTGVIRGEVTLKAKGLALHNATVSIPELQRSLETDEAGRYEFTQVPPGIYDVRAHMHHLTAETQTVHVGAGAAVEVNFQLGLAAVREEMTVTASGREETTLETFQTVTSLSSLELSNKSSSTSMGDLLDGQAGIAKRSFGPGTSRPVVRGFDGDRVLVLEDGIRTGTLSSQSGDHGEPIDPNAVERVEVVRGPATLLYGSNAVGGVVNAIGSHHQLHEHPHPGLHGHATAIGGTNNGQGNGSGNFEYGFDHWLLWGGGGGIRTGDYSSALGRVPNSETQMKHGDFGLGRYNERFSFSFGYGLQDGRYGVPFASEFEEEDPGAAGAGAEQVDVGWRRHRARLSGTLRDLGPALEQFNLKLSYTDWNHRELHGALVGTEFFNKQFIYRGEFQQRRKGRYSGSFGFWGMRRNYEAKGAEALSPPVDQDGIAAFALEQVEFEPFRVQFGARLEHNAYDPVGLRSRAFTGFSGGAGINYRLWQGGAFVANYTHSFRAPSLEELYNVGPHVGNVTFEVGDPNLRSETSDGLDLSLRHQSSKLQTEVNLFYYRMADYVFLAPTGAFQDGLRVAEQEQGDSRFLGAEARVKATLHPNVWLNLGLDAVDAELTRSGISLPRIPPVRGLAGVEVLYKGLSVKPEFVLANAQNQIFVTETRTAGYAVANLSTSYTVTQQHVLHVFGVNFFNMGNRLYRNHLSFIKDFAPEIGRGVRFSYALHFF